MKLIRNHTVAAIGVLLTGVLILAPGPGFAQAGAPAAADPPVAAAAADPSINPSAAALAGAKTALLGFALSKSMNEVADHLTDRSAGTLGVLFTIPVTFAIGFSQMGVDPKKPLTDPDLQKEFGAYLEKWLGPEEKPKLLALPAQLKGHGREFVRGLTTFEERVQKQGKASGDDSSQFTFEKPVTEDLKKYVFTVISPSEVKIAPVKGSSLSIPGAKTIEAVLDNGEWLIDLGDPALLLKALRDGSGQSTNGSKNHSSSDMTMDGPKTDPMADKMIDAAKAHDIAKMKRLLRINPKLVDAQDFTGESALYNTVFWEDVPTATFLIAHGAKVNAPNHFGKTPLDEALFFERKQMIALLKKHGAKPGVKKKTSP